MKTLRRLELTDALRARLRIVAIGAQHVSGGDGPLSHSGLDWLKVELAEELLAEIARQQAALDARVDAFEATPRRPLPVMEVTIRKARRRA